MSEIVGYDRVNYKKAVRREEDFPSLLMNIKGMGKVKGKNLYGFFVTDKEFAELKTFYCSDGWYDVPLVKLSKGEKLHLAPVDDEDDTADLADLDNKLKRGEFIISSDFNVTKKLKESKFPIRKISLLNKLGWPFSS